jgi:hypothetical protein
MAHDTPSHDYTPTYQIWLIYLKRQKKLWLGHKNTSNISIIWPWGQRSRTKCGHDGTPSHDYTPTYQKSLTYLKRQKSYGRADSIFANPFRFNNELTPFFSIFLYNFTYRYIFFIWTVTHQFFYLIFLRTILTIQLQKAEHSMD